MKEWAYPRFISRYPIKSYKSHQNSKKGNTKVNFGFQYPLHIYHEKSDGEKIARRHRISSESTLLYSRNSRTKVLQKVFSEILSIIVKPKNSIL